MYVMPDIEHYCITELRLTGQCCSPPLGHLARINAKIQKISFPVFGILLFTACKCKEPYCTARQDKQANLWDAALRGPHYDR